VEIGQVEAFLAVGTFGGFRRAADALRVTQPAISARIRALEQSLGVPLFVRSQSGLTLSAAGRAFRPHAEQLLHAVAQARQAVHDLRPASGGALQIAAALSICTYVLPDVLKRFQAAHPKVMITVRSGHSKEVLEMVLAGEAEIGLARSLHHPEVETLSLRDDPLVLVTRPESKVARARRVRLDDVAAQPLIFFDRGSSDWTLTHGLFRRAGLVPNVVLEVETIETRSAAAGCWRSRSATRNRSVAASTSSTHASARSARRRSDCSRRCGPRSVKRRAARAVRRGRRTPAR